MFAPILLILLAIAYRLLPIFVSVEPMSWLHNFSPLAAIALCGSLVFSRRWALAIPLVALFVSDVILNAHFGSPLFSADLVPRYLCLAAVAGAGWVMRKNPRLGTVLLVALSGSVLFYVVTNTMCWLGDSFYAKSAAGWMQALTIGHPEFPPTWIFFRNSLVGDLLFTGLFLATQALTRPALRRDSAQDGSDRPAAVVAA